MIRKKIGGIYVLFEEINDQDSLVQLVSSIGDCEILYLERTGNTHFFKIEQQYYSSDFNIIVNSNISENTKNILIGLYK